MICMNACMCVCVNVCACAFMYLYTYAFLYLPINTNTYIYYIYGMSHLQFQKYLNSTSNHQLSTFFFVPKISLLKLWVPGSQQFSCRRIFLFPGPPSPIILPINGSDPGTTTLTHKFLPTRNLDFHAIFH